MRKKRVLKTKVLKTKGRAKEKNPESGQRKTQVFFSRHYFLGPRDALLLGQRRMVAGAGMWRLFRVTLPLYVVAFN